MVKPLSGLIKNMSEDTLALNPELMGVVLQLVDNKYHNQPTEVDGIRFDSKKEGRRYVALRQAEQAGLIRDLKRQVPYVLLEPFTNNEGKKMDGITFIADFTYLQDGIMVIEDTKGEPTRKEPYFRLKFRLLHHKYRMSSGVRIVLT